MTLHFPNAAIPRPRYLGGDRWLLRNLRPVVVLFGKNSSGKSLLLRAWRDAYIESAHYVVPERSGTLAFQPSLLEIQINAKRRRDHSQENFLNEYRQHIVARIQGYFLRRGAIRANQLPGDPAELERLLAVLLPDFAFGLIGANPPYEIRRQTTGDLIDDVGRLSSGEAQIITLGLDLLTVAAIWDLEGRPQRLMLVDEPDAHIHPDLQARFADFLVQVAERFRLQIVVATHSTTLMAVIGQFGGDDAGVIYLDRTKAEFSAEPFTAVLKEISACLGGHALMGPLFGFPLLLVEGDDDYRIWSQVPRHHVTSFAVIPSRGEEIRRYQRSLERVFGAIREEGHGPMAFALLDGDKALPEEGPDLPQRHVRYVRLNCREAENLYLADETLSLLDTTWADAVEAIVRESERFGAKRARLATAPEWNRQQEDLKELINEVALILDPKGVHWTVRVGVAIGRAVPGGQLRDFLGEDLVARLWN